MSQEALKMALEALISYGKSPYIKQSHPKRWANGNKAIKALEETLAKQEQGELLYQPAALEAVDLLKFLGYVYQQTPKGLAWVNQQEQDEPVAWANRNDLTNFDMKVRTNGGPLHTVPLYTTPQQRTWVGLTDEEKSALWVISRAGLPRYAIYASLIEAKLKQKNGYAEEKNNG